MGVVFLMVAKPGLAGALAAPAVAFALGLASAAPGWRVAQARPPRPTGTPAAGHATVPAATDGAPTREEY